ncbi:hypothetical protein C8035_v002658 [Colletotrichum spinosum]|uniref:Extracellular protein n=1 Tax=Colletotrichum spinosum TaxID=1347390 RepID=A0A4R8Q7T6_9PEZI|nr:hypothetical protein C8035_v002658 [Colletotrichum spinosum]
MKFSFISTAVLAVGQASAHMAMTYPPPLRSKLNPFNGGDIDYSITSPMSASGSDFPCKGTLNLLGTSKASPVATWQAGQSYSMSIDGGANHNGGSCQAALSFDNGKTFTVIHSYIGNCPVAGASSLKFTLPADTPSSQNAIFAWTWFNNVGNREFYMNCAVITVTGSGGSQSSSSASFSSRPSIFMANINNGCSTIEGSDVMFPNPGPDVTSQSSKTAPPSGNCAVANPGSGSGSGSGGGSSAGPPTPSTEPVPSSNPVISSGPAVPVPTSIVPLPSPISPVQSSPALSQPSVAPTTRVPGGSSPSSSLPGGVFLPISSSSVSCDPEVEIQTTLATVSRPAQTNAATTAAQVTSVSPPPTPAATPVGGNNAEGAMQPGLKCTEEGQWNCVAGTHFQRCASGQWSVIMSMAAGTKCVSGVTEVLVWHKKRAHARRFRSRHI